MTKPTAKERRAHRRYDMRLDARGSAEAGGATAHILARNLSLGGLYCTSSADFPEMTRLEVRLMLPGDGIDVEDEPLDAEAVVVRRDRLEPVGGSPRFELALFFTKIDADSRQRLEQFLRLTEE